MAVITGASAGIGAAFAEALDRRGYSAVLIGRNLEALRRTAGRLSNPSEVVAADLTDPDGLRKVDTFLSGHPGQIRILINNAAAAWYGPVATHEDRLLSATVELNCSALVHLTRAILPAMLEVGGGIVNMSSLASRWPQPNLAVYAASKAFVDSFTRSLRDELLNSPVHVTCIRPSWVRTEFHARAGQSVDDGSDWLKPDDVVQRALVALEHNKEFVSVPKEPPLTQQARWWLRRWLRHNAPQDVLDAARVVRDGGRRSEIR